MKNVLIISPTFPPFNTPDMQRVRMSLPYFRQLGWEPTIVIVDEQFVDAYRDELLCLTYPPDIEIIKVSAYSKKLTSKIGLGSLSLRSLLQYKRTGNKLLRKRKFDLIFFSSTMFHVYSLGRYWKKKFNVPFVVDMQDPWRNDFWLDKPKQINPLKFKIAYNIHKYMEAYTMPYADGIISVSQAYIDTLRRRYPQLAQVPAKVITFGATQQDFKVVKEHDIPADINMDAGKLKVLYMGAVTPFFIPVIRLFFESLLEHRENLNKFHFYFIGTSYAKNSKNKMVETLGKELGISGHITEVPDRISYFQALANLMDADILFVPGSIDADYNASKIYNNILSGTPIFSIFHNKSLVKKAIENTRTGVVCGFDDLDNPERLKEEIYTAWETFLKQYHNKTEAVNVDFTADIKTKQITNLFAEAIHHHKNFISE